MPTETLRVPELGCDGCEEIVEAAVGELDGVSLVQGDQDDGTVTVEGDGFDRDAAVATIERAGYEVVEPPTPD